MMTIGRVSIVSDNMLKLVSNSDSLVSNSDSLLSLLHSLMWSHDIDFSWSFDYLSFYVITLGNTMCPVM